jgi:hypothetical protein
MCQYKLVIAMHYVSMCQCLLVPRVLLLVLPAHILIYSTQFSVKVCVLLHTSLLRVYQCSYLLLRTTSTLHKYVLQLHQTSTHHTSTGHRLVLPPPRSQPLSTGTHNPGNELEPLHNYATDT